ncbi:MAG TPA: hypothetical protein VN260_09800, partial [Dissulfurispiraceae bacterium]|nr:hypothetical protein [Dissulfurispiraceae bacterium]
MIAWVVLVVICSLFTAEPLFAQDVRIELEGQALFSDMKAKVRFGDGGTEINADDELDMDDQALFEGRLTWHTGPNSRLRLAYAYVSNDGDSTVNRSINFGGVTFPAGVRVTSELEVNYARFGWFWQFLSLAEGKVKFGTLLEAKALWADVSLAGDVQVGNSRGRREVSNDYFLILPAVGLALDIKPHPMFQIYGEVAGMTAGQY